jgi:hypothetical protein
MRVLLWSAGCCSLLMTACNEPERSFRFPTGPTSTLTATPTPPVAPPPRPQVEFLTITVGETVSRRIDVPPECLGLAGWPCQYFRLTAPSDGRLTVELTYKPDTQPLGIFPGPQGVDVSVAGPPAGEVWAQYFTATVTRATLPVTAGTVYEITLWYTFANLEYELHASLGLP